MEKTLDLSYLIVVCAFIPVLSIVIFILLWLLLVIAGWLNTLLLQVCLDNRRRFETRRVATPRGAEFNGTVGCFD